MSSELKVDKVSPATGTSTTLGDSGDTFTVPSGVTLDTSSSTLTLPSSAITGQTEKTSLADADKFLISDSAASGALKYVQKSNLPSGGLTLLSTVNVTSTVNSISMNSVFTTEYDNYFFVFSDVTGGIDNQPIYLRFKDTSDGALTASVYDYVNWGSNTSGSTVADYSANTSAIVLANNVQIGSGNVTEAKAYFFGTIYVPRDNSSPRGSVSATVMNWQSAYSRGGILYTNQSSAVFDNTTAVGGIQVYGGGGGGPTYLDNGSFKMYGIKGT